MARIVWSKGVAIVLISAAVVLSGQHRASAQAQVILGEILGGIASKLTELAFDHLTKETVSARPTHEEPAHAFREARPPYEDSWQEPAHAFREAPAPYVSSREQSFFEPRSGSGCAQHNVPPNWQVVGCADRSVSIAGQTAPNRDNVPPGWRVIRE
jgi:hypothetical protein